MKRTHIAMHGQYTNHGYNLLYFFLLCFIFFKQKKSFSFWFICFCLNGLLCDNKAKKKQKKKQQTTNLKNMPAHQPAFLAQQTLE